MRSVLILFVCALLSGSVLAAEELQGADAVLKRLDAPAMRRKPAKDDAPLTPVEELWDKLDAFRSHAEALPPDEAGREWASLFDRYWKIPPDARGDVRSSRHRWRNTLEVDAFLTALPPSAAWNAIATSLDESAAHGPSIRRAAFRALAAIMREDTAARNQAIEGLRDAISASNLLEWEKEGHLEPIHEAMEAMAKMDGAKEDRLTLFEDNLKKCEPQADAQKMPAQLLRVPDLASFAPPERAEALLRRAVALDATIDIRAWKTRHLAAQIATQNSGLLKRAHWDLIDDIDDAPLYEAMRKRFPDDTTDARLARQEADTVYLAALVAQWRMDDALKLLAAMRPTLSETEEDTSFVRRLLSCLEPHGLAREGNAFLRLCLASDPSFPFWGSYMASSARLGESDKALEFLRQTCERDDLKAHAREITDQCHEKVLLDAGRTEEGIAVLRRLIKAGDPRIAPADDNPNTKIRRPQVNALGRFSQADEDAQRRLYKYVGLTQQLGRLGSLLKRDDLEDEALEDFKEVMKAPEVSSMGAGVGSGMFSLLMSRGRFAAAEAQVVGELESSDAEKPQLLETLARIYDRAGRYGDVMRLLDGARQWGVADIAGLSLYGGPDNPMLLIAARALFENGKILEARKALRRLIENDPDCDAAYALLIRIGDPNIGAFIEACAAQTPWKARPLVWKAKLEFDSGRVEEAERTARAAIALDPMEESYGDRNGLRAYTVLEEILVKKGDAEHARAARDAAEALRLAEAADEWRDEGLTAAAIGICEKAPARIQDACCIQMRLAMWHSDLGEFSKAARCYERAFELLPGNVGHADNLDLKFEECFESAQGRDIAERVITRLAKESPDDPDALYLLGLLREAQRRHSEAATAFLRAAKLEPNFQAAWQHVFDLNETELLPPKDFEAAVLALLRLGPERWKRADGLADIGKLRTLWDEILAVEKARPPLPNGPIYPLAESKRAIELREKAERDSGQQVGQSDAADYANAPVGKLRTEFAMSCYFRWLIRYLEDAEGQ